MIIVIVADDLVIIAETLDQLLGTFCVWKTNLEKKGLYVNVGKTKIIISAQNAPKPVEAGFLMVCAIKVLDPTLSNVLFVAFGCTNAVQTSRVL